MKALMQSWSQKLARLSFGSMWGLAVVALLAGPMMNPQRAEASGGSDFYYFYSGSNCTNRVVSAGTFSVPLSASTRSNMRTRGAVSYERLSNAGQCYVL